MDPARNPFSPGAGTKPRVLAGRDEDIETAESLARRVSLGHSPRSIMYYGLRGVGKTVILNELEEIYADHDYVSRYVEVAETDDFTVVLSKLVRKLLLEVSRKAQAVDLVKKGLRALKSFVVSIPEGPDLKLDVEPLLGVADSGDLQDDLVDLFVTTGEAAKGAGIPIALFIDEVQYLEEDDFSALIASCHRASQLGLPLVVVCAGLPQIAGLAGEAKSYAERLFDFRPVDSLKPKDAKRALVKPAAEEGMKIDDQVAQIGLDATDGYPYFIQEYGMALWNESSSEQPTVSEAETAKEEMTRSLDSSFFKVRIDRATTFERKFMRALGSLGSGPQDISEVAYILDRKTSSIYPARAQLIHKGLVYSPDHGKIAFTVPHFDEFLDRCYGNQNETQRDFFINDDI
ncbi:ATP-binding protein [Salinibacter ruber]|uniref:ATP-binding protein n=1 Tax=Salinibacter ruber TaxID=146919 RepID=UPI000E56D955|nr:ATP-binding protein [Salinibacter ruber]